MNFILSVVGTLRSSGFVYKKDLSGSYVKNRWKEKKCQSRETSTEMIPGLQVRDDGGFDYILEIKIRKKWKFSSIRGSSF